MSDLLNKASLVMVPSGYKEDTVYSVVPSDGSGDLSFTRASNGTRINSAGLVEVCPWNLNTNSEDFATGWSGANRALTADATTAPNGTTTADQLGATGGTAYYAKYITSPVGAHTFSVFLKYGNRQYQQIYGYSGTAYFAEATFDLQNGTVYSIQHGNASIENVGGGWYRCSIYGTTTGVTIEMGIENIAVSTYTYAWGAQLNIGSTAKPYFPTTDRLNVPRLTYQNGGGGCPSLLLEKQSTNYIPYSEDYTNAAWTKNGVSVTANNTTSPDGTQNADKLTSNDPSGSVYRIYETAAIPSDSVCTVSCYFKYENWQYAFIVADNYSGVGKFVVFDLINGTNTFVSSGYTATISSVGNGWYRCTMTGEMGITAYCQFGLAPTSTTYNNISIANGKNLYLWGTQREISSYPTSYIPTTSASATRVADLATVNLPNTNMTFTAYLELDEASLGTPAGDWFGIFSNVSTLGRAYGYANQFGFADAYSLGVASGTKMVWKQESGSTAKIFKGGALVGTSTTGTYTDPFNRLRMDGALLDKPVKIKQFVYFDNALTDAECIQLTA
jgi:hypothetical protein